MVTRTYHSPRRDQAATNTRLAILEAAETLFAEQGYPRTSVAQIAAAAQVSANTVYQSLGGKPQLVAALAERVATDELITDSLDTVERAQSGRQVITEVSESSGRLVERHYRALAVVWDNAVADPLVAEVAASVRMTHMQRLQRIVLRLRQIGALRPDISGEHAVDVLYFYFGVESWRGLHAMGWPWEKMIDWLVGQASAALLRQAPFL
jgi:AcrR family transcriptional regulator